MAQRFSKLYIIEIENWIITKITCYALLVIGTAKITLIGVYMIVIKISTVTKVKIKVLLLKLQVYVYMELVRSILLIQLISFVNMQNFHPPY
jgi:hypothetical protein